MADFNRYETAATLINRVLQSMGLPVPTSYVGNTDPVAVQMLSLLTDCGRELATKNWKQLYKVWSFNTTPGVLSYDIPEDLEFFIDNTGWNRTARVPLIGPMTDQQFALLEARQLGGTTLYIQYRTGDDKLVFYFVPTTPQNITITYRSKGWVRDQTLATRFKDFIENDGDIVEFTPLLVQKMLRLKWRDAKGFDTTNMEKEFTKFLDSSLALQKPNPDLHLSRRNRYPYLGIFNLPDTGYGSSS